MLDRATFVRPIAHRGLHGPTTGELENTGGAFTAAIAKGYGIECDLQPASDGTPFVFHDRKLARLVEAKGDTTDLTPARLRKLKYRTKPAEHILSLADMLELVDGRVPILIEVKTDWDPPRAEFIAKIAKTLKAYRGPYAIMSFDPVIVAALKPLLPDAPRGIVSGVYDDSWREGKLSREKAWRLTNLLESRDAAPDFFAYHVKALPTPVTRFLREALGIPLFTWTVRTAADLKIAHQWADAPIFEDVDPTVR
ncbi:MAG: glycerophosphodiester phosphodiesterase [Proteobacteria bacterium]|nr:glycerophosphodiester phosphodiesterase [Pseudomonadota bacterium]